MWTSKIGFKLESLESTSEQQEKKLTMECGCKNEAQLIKPSSEFIFICVAKVNVVA